MSIRKFRPDIEVLRAIAVIAVIIAHSKLALPGGFIGVDIFFVISGFLITKHLHDEVVKTGTVSLKSFYARRVLRIFPASMLVLLLTLLGAFLFLSPLQLINYCWDAFFAAISGLNYRLAVTGTDYFQSTTTPSPFQHFWSLAVEEQFYLIWPLLILIIAKIFIRKPKANLVNTETKVDKVTNAGSIQVSTGTLPSDFILPINEHTKSKTNSDEPGSTKHQTIVQDEHPNFGQFKTIVSFLLILVIVISLFLSYKITGESQMWAYFGLHTRAWQLAIGALISFNLPLLSKIPTKAASILSWVGLAGLVIGFTIISETTVYPGLWALLPTLSTALIVVAGTNFSKYSFEWAFNSKISRWVGKISYSLYLIHWPIFVFVFYQLGENIKATDRIAAILISLMLAGLSLVLIENPVRFNKVIKSSFKLTYQMGLILILVVSGASIGVGYAKQKISLNQKLVASASNKSESDVFNKLQEAIDLKELPIKLNKPLEQVAKETGSNCISVESVAIPSDGPKCKLGEKNSSQTIVLLGDSHANQWTKAFDEIAKKNNYQLIPFTKSGCSMTDIKHFNPLLKRDYTECYSYRTATMEEITKIKPDIIVTTELIYQNSTPETYSTFLQKLQSMSNQVVKLTDTPRPTQNIPECLAKNATDIIKCSFSIENGNNNGGQEKEKETKIANDLGVNVIDTTNWFCLDKVCPSVSDNIIIYNDDSHISDSYIKYLEDIVDNQLFKIGDDYNKVIIAATKLTNLPANLVLPIEQVSKDKFRNGACIASFAETEPTDISSCKLGDTKSSKNIVLIGDSHAHQWTQAISDIATKNNYNLSTYTKSGCPMSDITVEDPIQKRDYTECYSWRKEALAQIEKLNPDIIITSSLNYERSTSEKYSEFVNKLKSIGKKVIRIEDTPYPKQNIPECLSKNIQNIQLCDLNAVKNTFNYTQKEVEAKAATNSNITIIDPREWFCVGQTCPPVINNIVVYHDESHISNTYAKSLTDLLNKKIFNIGNNQLLPKILEATKITSLPNKLVGLLDQATFDTLGGKCIDSFEAVTPNPEKVCTLGDIKSSKTIVLIGDSHAQQWIPALDPISQRNGYKLITYMKSTCSLADIKLYDDTNKKDYVECTAWRKEALAQVKNIHPDIIISSEILHPNSTIEKYSELMTKLRSMSEKVIKIIDNPRSEFSIPECLAKNTTNIQKCSYKTDKAIYNKDEAKKELEESKKLGIPIIDTLDWFCADETCPPVVDNNIVYYDTSHISMTYSKYLSQLLGEQLFPKDKYTNNKLKEALKLTTLPVKFVTPLEKVFEDRPQFDCISSLTDLDIQSQDRCFKKFSKSNKTIALIGDSHAYQWSETFAKIAQDEDYNLLILTKPGCPTHEISVIDPNLKRDYNECYTWRQKAIERMQEVKPDIIITTGVIYDQSTTDKYTDYIKKLQSISKKVVSIVDSRKPTQNIPECLAKNISDVQKCSFSTDFELNNGGIQKDKQTKAAIAMGVDVIETSDWFCLDKVCPPIIDNIVVYQDSNYISNTYAKYLTKSMKEKLKLTINK